MKYSNRADVRTRVEQETVTSAAPESRHQPRSKHTSKAFNHFVLPGYKGTGSQSKCFQEFLKYMRENRKTRKSERKKNIRFFWLNRSKNQNNITNTRANTVDASSLVEFVSLIASLVLLLTEAYQRAPFISARIKPLL